MVVVAVAGMIVVAVPDTIVVPVARVIVVAVSVALLGVLSVLAVVVSGAHGFLFSIRLPPTVSRRPDSVHQTSRNPYCVRNSRLRRGIRRPGLTLLEIRTSENVGHTTYIGRGPAQEG